MTIRSRLQITILFTIAAAIAVLTVVLAANHRVNEKQARVESVQTTLKTLLHLDSLTLEYLMRAETRVATQWRVEQDAIGKQLRAFTPATPEEKAIVELLQKDYKLSRSLFDQLTALGREAERTAGREVLSGQLQLKIRSQVSGILQLQMLMRKRIAITQEWSFLIVLSLSVALMAVIAGVSQLFGRSILAPLDALQKGMEIVGAGDLEHRVGLATRDEIGDLSRAFDRMVENLRQAKQAIQSSQASLNEAQRITHIGSWELDLTNNTLSRSDELYRIFEIDRDNSGASSEAFLSAIHPDDMKIANEAYSDSASSRTPYDIVYRLRFADGRIKFVNERGQTHYDKDGRPVRSIGTVEDITQVRLAEDGLRRLNRELRAISDCNQALMRAVDEPQLLNDICRIICDEAGYHMAFVAYVENDEAKTVRPVAWAGVEEGYLEQAKLTWADTERGRGPVGLAVRGGETACIQDFAFDPRARPWRDNALKRGYRSVIALPLKDESANTFGILAIYSTQTNAFIADEIRLLEELAGDLAFGVMVLRARIERKRAEEEIAKLDLELQRQLEALEQAKKELEAISYSVSHDLKVPLRAIDGFAALLREEYRSQLAGDGERYLAVVHRNTARMGHLIDSLLDFISLSQSDMRMKPVDVGTLAKEVFEELQASAPGRDIRLRVGDLPQACCDRDLIRRALANLIGNAIKFTAPRIEASIEIGGAAEGMENAYFVRDNGVGFDAHYMDKLFGVGLRLHSPDEFEGAGIGLAIVKRIISRHGGRVWAESKVGEGATFYFTLPQIESAG